ncbi:DUF748 domain-containing protein [Paucibacter sp. APW11]|uniref:DUF748 domain-containing protein n=1 Tax=Roseateles aquae TaxID=3077235 RepID=A0ABU3P841_9BURK|nr:DUF748 domain-containing protein [Paucibacter sp. APW11]MDT8998714.1 DUF748 domain-containing protein [Paucibacter sp. APW11]
MTKIAYSRWRWALVLLIGVPALLMLAAATLLPRWLAGPGMEAASEALGRKVSVQEAEVQPWRLGVVLKKLQVAARAGDDGGAALLDVDRVALSLSWRSIWHRQAVLDSLRIERPRLRLARIGEGRYSIDDLLQRFQADAPSDERHQPELRWAAYNIEVLDGELLLDDRPLRQQHRVDGLHLALPFISKLGADIHVAVKPALRARVDGSAFEAEANLRPFSPADEAQLALKLRGFELQRLRPYWPAALPVQITKGGLDVDLALRFKQAPGQAAEMQVAGELVLNELAAQCRSGSTPFSDCFSLQQLKLPLQKLLPLQRQVALGDVVLQQPRLALVRDRQGRVLLPGSEGFGAATASGGTSTKSAGPSAAPWRLSLAGLTVSDGGVQWRDEAQGGTPSLQAEALQVKLGAWQWPLSEQAAPAVLTLKTLLSALPAQGKEQADLTLEARVSAALAELQVDVSQLPLRWASELLPLKTEAGGAMQLAGLAGGRLRLQVDQPLTPAALDRSKIDGSALALRDLALKSGRSASTDSKAQTHLQLAELKLDQLKLVVSARDLQLGRLQVRGLQLPLRRSAGSVTLAGFKPEGAGDDRAKAAQAAPDATPWHVSLQELALDGAAIDWQDDSVSPAARLAIKELRLNAQDLRQQGQTSIGKLQLLDAVLRDAGKSAAAPAGRLKAQVQLNRDASNLGVSGQLQLDGLPLAPLQGYLHEAGLPRRLQLEQGALSYRGAFAMQGPEALSLKGDAALASLRVQRSGDVEAVAASQPLSAVAPAAEPLLRWQALRLAGLQLQLRPQQATQLSLDQIALSDFFARLSLDAKGQFNLRDLNVEAAEPAAPKPVPAQALAPASPPLQLLIRSVRVDAGEVAFQDRFIKPNYSARLSELQGELGSISSNAGAPAALRIGGRIAGEGVLEIAGTLNPLSHPLQLDLRADARDIALRPLSPYAEKYAGYAIANGSLSSKLQYKITADGSLQAQNQVILDQLQLGDKVDSPDATRLPVALALSLLKDRNGVIDVSLPISGSVNDPEFSVGGLVLRLVGNLIGRALTSPFSLFAGAEAHKLHQIGFKPGTADWADPGQLEQLAQALQQRSQLQLTIAPWVDPAGELSAWRSQWLSDALLQLWRRQHPLAAQGTLPTGPERAALLRKLYLESPKIKHERTLIGFKKELPPEQMEALLLAAQLPTESDWQALALQRAVALREALLARGIAAQRLQLLGARLRRDGEDGDPAWQPHAQLSLSSP